MKRIIFLVCAAFLTNLIISEEINENVKNFSQLPDVYDVKISPNGKMVGVLREIDQERMVSIIDLESRKLIHNVICRSCPDNTMCRPWCSWDLRVATFAGNTR